ncbi:ATP-dependent DNA helicase chl1 [Friedmanniomyces endolithicus]|nr:ATP-dependent DNA helicase chl1 [Friedmanniomyces endolithicus]KAK0803021.1 ATP-dependent DNA helicase chl1 [Friedmanniomyces endolithicus]KAK0807696.1 ATP-dependent DNA helicase chl1 [Friedmanniomyces endolithicus]KAK0881625.1 ATP-dependent DNA helicase chl1 [Friedmanniomyces endolithicus]
MVKLIVSAVGKEAIDEYCGRKRSRELVVDDAEEARLQRLSGLDSGKPIEHHDLIEVSSFLTERGKGPGARRYRLDVLLRGALVYQPPPPPKPEPRLRAQEEQRQYERMVNPAPPAETFNPRTPSAGGHTFNPATSHGQTGVDEVDEVTYADVHRQMILIINILVSIITCSVFIWIAARRWSVPQRLGLSMSGSGLVAAAEVAIYFGYIKRLNDAKQKEVKAVERKEILETWVIDKAQASDFCCTNMAPKDFHHPFQPYDIQQHFMEAMYDCIERGKVGIFESPTGTGKSLSLICCSLTWLREHRRKGFDEALAAVTVDDDDPAWMAEHAVGSRRREMRRMREEFEARLSVVREQENKLKERHAHGVPTRKKRRFDSDDEGSTADEDQYVLDDYDVSKDGKTPADGQNPFYSMETTKLMEDLGMLQQKRDDNSLDVSEDLKIYFCSRTHSQLSQFVRELQRVSLPPGMPPEPAMSAEVSEPLKHLTLGSRKNLCINPKVSKLGGLTAINERCMELQQTSAAVEHKCPFLPGKDNEDSVLDFRDHTLAKIRDIEEMTEVGKRLGICPYYASRTVIDSAEMVTLPYPLLLQKSAREALGISLRGHVIIIDEAHNLMNAIEGIHSTQISEVQLNRARDSLLVYLQKFRNRLKGSNRVYVTQVVRVIDSLLLFVTRLLLTNTTGGTIDANKLLSGKGVDQVDLVKLVRYISESKLARKVEGYASHVAQLQKTPARNTKEMQSEHDVPTLTHIQTFLMTLMNPSKEGRFFWSRESDTCILRYMLLDPAVHFQDIVQDAQAVILAGGTMSPMDDYRHQLFPYLPSLVTFSCGHLIPPSNLLIRTVASDQAGPLDFSYKSRSSAMIMRIGQALLDLAPLVHGGLVVFLPSYSSLEQVASCWRKEALLTKLEGTKQVFWDGRTEPAEATFKAYSQAVSANRKGAILLSVIGGKLSEGINFSDDLGRCVVVVGLPFPNLETPEWKAKMQYLEDKARARGEPAGAASKEHAENVCMRAVNQAVGRVIRHKDDWAGIVLIDQRYAQKRIREKLPGWIRESFPTESPSHLRGVMEDAKRFFKGKTRL